MKKILFFVSFSLFFLVSHGQVFSGEGLLSSLSFAQPKFDTYLARTGFAFIGKAVQNDTLIRMYEYRRTKGFKTIDSIRRSVIRADVKENTFLSFQTESWPEFTIIKSQLISNGFYCNHDKRDTLCTLLYQNKDAAVRLYVTTQDSTKMYSMQFIKKVFPRAKDIFYADDLLTFTSHEYLVYYFGEKNVKKDIYFLSQDKVVKCSVLFLNTSRQAVFLWADEENQCTIAKLLFGGQQNLESAMESGKYVEQNSWSLKNGLRPGMTLAELRMLNGNSFKFYGGNSPNSGSVIPDNAGKLDFKKEEIVLACLNCSDDKFTSAKVVDADECLREGRILFVLSVILHPL